MNIIETFYNSFKNLDAERMADCYHDQIEFYDPGFGTLRGDRARNMWRMLCESQKGKDFEISYSDIRVEADRATAHWEAFYTFSKTNRKVHNKIDAQFLFKDGKIIKHTDSFDLHNWATQALGFKGWLLGGTGFFRKKLQQQTNRLLDRYEASKS